MGMVEQLLAQAMVAATNSLDVQPSTLDMKDFYLGVFNGIQNSQAAQNSAFSSTKWIDRNDAYWNCINDEYGAAEGVWKALFESALDNDQYDAGLYHPIAFGFEDILFKDCTVDESTTINKYNDIRVHLDNILVEKHAVVDFSWMIELIEMRDNIKADFPNAIDPIDHLENAAKLYKSGESYGAGTEYGYFYMAVTTGDLEPESPAG